MYTFIFLWWMTKQRTSFMMSSKIAILSSCILITLLIWAVLFETAETVPLPHDRDKYEIVRIRWGLNQEQLKLLKQLNPADLEEFHSANCPCGVCSACRTRMVVDQGRHFPSYPGPMPFGPGPVGNPYLNTFGPSPFGYGRPGNGWLGGGDPYYPFPPYY